MKNWQFILCLVAANIAVWVGAAYAGFDRPALAVAAFNLLGSMIFLSLTAINISRIGRHR